MVNFFFELDKIVSSGMNTNKHGCTPREEVVA